MVRSMLSQAMGMDASVRHGVGNPGTGPRTGICPRLSPRGQMPEVLGTLTEGACR